MDNLVVEITPGLELSDKDLEVINKIRKLKFKPDVEWDHKVHNIFHPWLFFIVREQEDIKAFGCLLDINLIINNQEYSIQGIKSVASVESGKGYGKALMQAMINFANDNEGTLIGFCDPKNRGFYLKSGLKIKEAGNLNFFHKMEDGKECSEEGDVLYYSERPNEITNAIENNIKITHLVPHW